MKNTCGLKLLRAGAVVSGTGTADFGGSFRLKCTSPAGARSQLSVPAFVFCIPRDLQQDDVSLQARPLSPCSRGLPPGLSGQPDRPLTAPAQLLNFLTMVSSFLKRFITITAKQGCSGGI